MWALGPLLVLRSMSGVNEETGCKIGNIYSYPAITLSCATERTPLYQEERGDQGSLALGYSRTRNPAEKRVSDGDPKGHEI